MNMNINIRCDQMTMKNKRDSQVLKLLSFLLLMLIIGSISISSSSAAINDSHHKHPRSTTYVLLDRHRSLQQEMDTKPPTTYCTHTIVVAISSDAIVETSRVMALWHHTLAITTCIFSGT